VLYLRLGNGLRGDYPSKASFSEVQIAFIWDWEIGWRVDVTGFKDAGLIAAHATLIVSQKNG
jgi:hypothetical protein